MAVEYLYESYFDETEKVLMKIRKTQQENILKAAELVSECIKNDGLVRTSGTGHSHILAEEIFFRAGTLAPVSAILEPSLMTYREAIKSSAMERLEGLIPRTRSSRYSTGRFKEVIPLGSGDGAKSKNPCGEIKLIVRGDDLGFCHSTNLAFEKVYKEGILTSAEIMVPSPWFNEAVEIARKNPKLDIGLHLVLTSEWRFYSWGPVLPVTEVPSLVDKDGYFFSSLPFFSAAKPKMAEVEKELRAQIELALEKGVNISHLSNHMFVANSSPKLKAIAKKLAAEYKLLISGDVGEKRGEWFPTYSAPPLKKEKVLAGALKKLTPGLWLIGNHPGLDTLEMRAMKAMDPHALKHVAAHRAAETKALTSKGVKRIIKNRKIKLISYRDIRG